MLGGWKGSKNLKGTHQGLLLGPGNIVSWFLLKSLFLVSGSWLHEYIQFVKKSSCTDKCNHGVAHKRPAACSSDWEGQQMSHTHPCKCSRSGVIPQSRESWVRVLNSDEMWFCDRNPLSVMAKHWTKGSGPGVRLPGFTLHLCFLPAEYP